MHQLLAQQSRLAKVDFYLLTRLLLLVGAGVLGALATSLVDLHLRIPGHAILKAIFPVAFGFALVPYRGSGTIMGCAAISTACLLQYGFRIAPGSGALASLALIGPTIDLMIWRSSTPRQLYLGFAMAGMLANSLAFVIRTATKLGGLDQLEARPWQTWLSQALFTYMACGLVAGLVAAAVSFRYRGKSTAGDRSGSDV